jgi:hypothetical protein
MLGFPQRQWGSRRPVAIRLHIFLAALLCCSMPLGTVSAETLTVPANELKSLFDHTMPYRGQTFILPETVRADKLTVFISPSIFQAFSFHLLLTEVDTANGLHPTRVLFESEPLDIPRGVSDILPRTADLGGIELRGGQVYAFILDIFVTLREIRPDPATLWHYATLTGMNREAAYAGGEHISLQIDCEDPLTGLPCGSRESHFAASWTVEEAEDMGFILEYNTVPFQIPIVPALELLLLKNN